jgi:transposase InsO family protein
MVEAVGDAPPRYLLRDRDSIYDARSRARLRGLGVRCLLSPPKAPMANAICERYGLRMQLSVSATSGL